MNWIKALYEALGSQYPRLSIVIAALVGAAVFGTAWWLIGKEYEKERRQTAPSGAQASSITSSSGPTLSPVQERLLDLLAGYQRRFGAHKLIIVRETGGLHFDSDPARGAGISLLQDLYGSATPSDAVRFEQLMEGMPGEYVRFLAETRLDNPFVVTVTDRGMEYLRPRK